jgi:hypothetical protein
MRLSANSKRTFRPASYHEVLALSPTAQLLVAGPRGVWPVSPPRSVNGRRRCWRGGENAVLSRAAIALVGAVMRTPVLGFLVASWLLSAETVISNETASAAGRFYEVRGVKLYVETHGSGVPILFQHGGLAFFDNSFVPQRDYFSSAKAIWPVAPKRRSLFAVGRNSSESPSLRVREPSRRLPRVGGTTRARRSDAGTQPARLTSRALSHWRPSAYARAETRSSGPSASSPPVGE